MQAFRQMELRKDFFVVDDDRDCGVARGMSLDYGAMKPVAVAAHAILCVAGLER